MLLTEFFVRVLAPCRRIFHAAVTVTFAYYSTVKNKLFEGESYYSHPRKFSDFSFNEDRGRIQLFISMRIRILLFISMRIRVDPDLDPCQTLKSQNVEFFTLKIYLKSVTGQKTYLRRCN
jgi:hypothetical protein